MVDFETSQDSLFKKFKDLFFSISNSSEYFLFPFLNKEILLVERVFIKNLMIFLQHLVELYIPVRWKH